MGWLSGVKNFLTGGGAELRLSVDTPSLAEPFMVRVRVTVGEADCNVGKVYLRILAEETVRVPDVAVASSSGNRVEIDRREVTATTATYDDTVELGAAQVLKAKRSYDWELEVKLPDDALPTYQGRLARHEWKFLAGLDVTGNDPDSGWVKAEIY